MRLSELDFAKGVLIVLMVMFHLTYSEPLCLRQLIPLSIPSMCPVLCCFLVSFYIFS